MIDRAQIMNEMWLRLNKSPVNPGFYTVDKVRSVIQEATDFVSAEMMLADEGFAHKLGYLSPVAGQVSLAIPFDYAMILEVRYLVGNVYWPMSYNQQWGDVKWASGSGAVQMYPASYKLLDNTFYFNPPIGVGGLNYIEVEYAAYPRRFQLDSDVLPAQFDRAMYWFIVYKSCNLLAGQFQQTIDDWQQNENLWGQKMIMMINLRTRQSIPIRDFEG